MHKLAAGLTYVLLASVLPACGPCAFAQNSNSQDGNSQSSNSTADSNFPAAGYLPLPPHFQPRRAEAAVPVSVAPPSLPSYAQPAIPADGYLWMPGFWAWREEVPDYYWVPGTWVKPPRPGLLWTPAYWSRTQGGYDFHAGYWAADVGFYGGIDYGFGYSGDGYRGGRWQNGAFLYNRSANNLGSANIAHAYDQAATTVGKPAQANFRASFNGGRQGTKAQPTSQQQELAHGRHFAPTAEQQNHFAMAAKDRSLYSKLNRGEPGVAATAHAGVLTGSGIVRSNEVSNEVLTDMAPPIDAATTGVNPK